MRIGLLAGALFAIGLVLAGMESPVVILSAFRFDSGWDPRLFAMFVGSVVAHAPVRRWLARRGRTVRGEPLRRTPPGRVDGRLVVGSLLFGVGWGLGGVCPGPAFVAVLSGAPHAAVFFVGMVAGFVAHRKLEPALV